MSLNGKNKKYFSYNNKDCSNKDYSKKDFEKTKSYHSVFTNSNFSFSSFRGSQLKYCNFNGASFEKSEFYGTNLRGSSFEDVVFNNAIFVNTILDKVNLKNARFVNCYFIGINLNKYNSTIMNENNYFLLEYPDESLFSSKLIETVEELRNNDFIRRSNTLHRKNKKINTLSLTILLKEYNEDDLIKRLKMLPVYVKTQFYTLSSLEILLHKIKVDDII